MLNENEFVFDPNLIESKDGPGAATEKVEEEKLNLFKDGIFDETPEKKEPEKLDDDPENIIEDKDAPSPEDIKDTDDPSSKAVFSVVLGQDLMEKGILSSFDEEEISKITEEHGEAAAITAMLESQTKSTEASIKEAYDQNYQEYLSLIQSGVTKEDASGIQQLENYNKSLEEIDLTTEDDNSVAARKELLTLNYRLTTKWSEDKIQKYVNKVYEEGSDIEEIDEAKSNLSTYVTEQKAAVTQAAEDQAARAKEAQQKIKSDYESYITKTDEYFKGEKVSKENKQKIQKLLFDPVKTPDGNVTNQIWAKRDENPASFDAKIAYLETIGYFDDAPLDKFIKKGTTKAASNLDSFLQDNAGRNYKKSAGKSFGEEGASKKDFLDF